MSAPTASKPAPVAAPVTPAPAEERTWEQRLADLVADPRHELAPLYAPPLLVDGRLQLTPYWLRRDITALIGWAEVLEEHPLSAGVEPAFSEQAPGVTRVSVIGMLFGEVVEILGETHRPIPFAKDGVVPWDALFELAAAEAEAAARELADVPLMEHEAADPLRVEQPS